MNMVEAHELLHREPTDALLRLVYADLCEEAAVPLTAQINRVIARQRWRPASIKAYLSKDELLADPDYPQWLWSEAASVKDSSYWYQCLHRDKVPGYELCKLPRAIHKLLLPKSWAGLGDVRHRTMLDAYDNLERALRALSTTQGLDSYLE